jgi:Domain of unknown function (DUF1707)
MLLGDADREALYDTLKAHAAAGRLDIAELERRVALVAEADTREAASVAVADLPPLPGVAERDQRPRRGRGHGEVDKPGVDWRPTGEVFRDPRTRRVMRVWTDPAGDRHYVAE